jgi:hypothetical protein
MALATALSPDQIHEVIQTFVDEFVLASEEIHRTRVEREDDGEFVLVVTVGAGFSSELPETFSPYQLPVRVELGEPGRALLYEDA